MISELNQQDIAQAAEILLDFWITKKINYSKEEVIDYILRGHEADTTVDKFFVYKKDNEVIGVISLLVYDKNMAEIKDLVVKREFRGKGIGKEMVEYLIKMAEEYSRQIAALVRQENKMFYEKLGFKASETVKEDIVLDENIFVMTLAIKPKNP